MNNPIDSRQLRAFVSLAKTGSFTLAAKELFLTQSAISHSLRALEEDLGCRLFDRMGKKNLLSLAGEQFLPHAEKILMEMDSARRAVTRLSEWGESRLRVCASTTACQYILPTVLRDFQKSFPKVRLSIDSGDTNQAVELLENREIECAICMEPEADQRFDFRPLFTDELAFVVGPDHPWAKVNRVDRDEISDQRYVLYNKGTHTFGLIEKYFREEQVSFQSIIELRSMEAIKELVKAGMGISILAGWIVEKEIAEGSICALPLGKKKLRRNWGVLHWRNPNLPLPLTQFIESCARACSKLKQSGGPTKG